MAQLITAPVGTGKTLKCIELCFKYLNEGREVYTNIIGIKVSGVRVIESNNLQPFDWRDLPNGSVLIFDEAHEHPAFSERDLLRNHKIQYWEDELKRINTLDLPATKRKELLTQTKEIYSKQLKDEKEKILDIGISMSMHRHFDIELILVTQNPTKLNRDVLGNITIHKVMRRKFGFEAANIWTFGEAMTTWGKTVADGALVKEYWKFPKHLFKFYNSAESHNVEKYFPKKYYAFACIPLLIFYLGYSKASETGFFGLFPKDEVVQEKAIEQPEYEVITVSDPTKTEEQLLLQAKENFNPDVECRKAVNLELPECVQWFDNLSNSNASVMPNGNIVQTVSYNPDQPYGFEYVPQVQPKDFPRMSGVMTLSSGRLMAIDQQGNYMPNISQQDCRKWLQGYRPFNYFKDTQQQMPQQPQYQVQQPPAPQQIQNPYSAERVSTSDSGNQNSEISSL